MIQSGGIFGYIIATKPEAIILAGKEASKKIHH